MSFSPIFAGQTEGGIGRNGIYSVSFSYWVSTLREAMFWTPQEIFAATGLGLSLRNPRVFNQEWGNDRMLASGGKDGAYRVTFNLEGIENPGDDANFEYEADGTASEDPIEAHPDLEYLMEKYSGRRDEDRVIFGPTLTMGGETFPNPLCGVKTYFVPGITWTRTYVTLHPSPSVTMRIGMIDPAPRALDGYIPDLPGKRNWLKIVGKPVWRGNVWKVTEAWQMSGPEGWNEDLYR